jgi:hypothetical protein
MTDSHNPFFFFGENLGQLCSCIHFTAVQRILDRHLVHGGGKLNSRVTQLRYLWGHRVVNKNQIQVNRQAGQFTDEET